MPTPLVEIALAEFPTLSDRAIADLCGVDGKTVAEGRARCGNSAPETPTPPKRTGKDGKSYPASKPKKPDLDDLPEKKTPRPLKKTGAL